MLRPIMIAALLGLGVSGCNRPPAPQAASHPPALDLTCSPEPTGITDAQVIADDASDAAGNGRPNEEAFNNATLIAGRNCRDALGRVCLWHVERGDKEVDCDRPKQ